MLVTLPVAALAAVLILLGGWGRRNAAILAVVPGMEAERIARRERTMRRGAVACRGVGTAFLAVAVLSVVFPP